VSVTDPGTGAVLGTCAPAIPTTLLPGASVVCTAIHTVTQSDIDAGRYTNVAIGDSNETAPGTDDETVPIVQSPALSVLKEVTSTGPYESVGDVVAYSITITNTGNQVLTGVAVTDPGVGAVLGACTPAIPTTLALGARVVCTASHAVTQSDIDAGRYTNVAIGDSNQTNPDGDDETVPIAQHPALEVLKTVISTGPYDSVGDVITYSITATNTGNQTLTGVSLTDVGIGAALETCNAPIPATLQPGGLVECVASHTVTQADLNAGHYTNVATGDSNQTAPDSDDETVPTAPPTPPQPLPTPPTPSPPVIPSTPAIAITKSPDEQTIQRGKPATWTITVRNIGNVTLTNVTVNDTAAPRCARTSAALPSLASMAPDASATYTCTRTDVPASFTNVAVATGTPPTGSNVSASDSARVTVRAPLRPRPVTHPSIGLEKSPTSQMVALGGTATFHLTVTNSGDVALTRVTVRDPRSPDCNRRLGTLRSGASRSYTCTRPNVRADFINTATVIGFLPGGGTARASATAPVEVSQPFVPAPRQAIRIDKGPNSQSTAAGGKAMFRITIRNTGNVLLRNVGVTDPGSPSCNRRLGTLAAGKTTTYTCARANVTRSFVNRATVIATAPKGRKVTDSDTAAVTTKQPEFTG
jgi:uncharacterized repeat protein (TIGR01451 family)